MVALEHIDSQLLLTQVGKAGISAPFSRSHRTQKDPKHADKKNDGLGLAACSFLFHHLTLFLTHPFLGAGLLSPLQTCEPKLLSPWLCCHEQGLDLALPRSLISGSKHKESSPSQVLCQCPTDRRMVVLSAHRSWEAQWNDSMSHYLHRLEPGLSTVPCQHSGWHHFPSARSPPHKWKYSCCCTQMPLRMGSNPCFHGRGSPEVHTRWLKEECQIRGLCRVYWERLLLSCPNYLHIQNPQLCLSKRKASLPVFLFGWLTLQISVLTLFSFRRLPSQPEGEGFLVWFLRPCPALFMQDCHSSLLLHSLLDAGVVIQKCILEP